MNATSLNQSNHCLLVQPAPPWAGTIDAPNTLLTPLGAAVCRERFASALVDFGQMRSS